MAPRKHQMYLPLMPLAFEQFDLREYDLVISSSSACAKGVITRPDAVHICYCHTPCRYVWDLYHDYTAGLRSRALIAPVAHWLRVWDRVSSDRVELECAPFDATLAYGRHTAVRILRDATSVQRSPSLSKERVAVATRTSFLGNVCT